MLGHSPNWRPITELLNVSNWGLMWNFNTLETTSVYLAHGLFAFLFFQWSLPASFLHHDVVFFLLSRIWHFNGLVCLDLWRWYSILFHFLSFSLACFHLLSKPSSLLNIILMYIKRHHLPLSCLFPSSMSPRLSHVSCHQWLMLAWCCSCCRCSGWLTCGCCCCCCASRCRRSGLICTRG